jgi:hypothetical protein
MHAAANAPRTINTGQDADRAHVGVLIEGLADGEPQAPERDVVRDVGMTCRAEQDRVVVADLLTPVLEHHARAQLERNPLTLHRIRRRRNSWRIRLACERIRVRQFWSRGLRGSLGCFAQERSLAKAFSMGLKSGL